MNSLRAGCRERAQKTLAALRARYPDPATQLVAGSPWELLVATVLAAQCTDVRVNTVTPALFARWPSPVALAGADRAELEAIIRPTGFYRNKAKNLIGAAVRLRDVFAGAVPRSLEDLVSLPGVARKTANVVLFGAFGINEGLAVDTHVKRIAYRLGLTGETLPDAVEKDLTALFPREEWGNINHSMVLFGRDVCHARRPRCRECDMSTFCPRLAPPGKIFEPRLKK
ncbi:MAG: endonuclease III [Desulfovibrio sp.]|jgi:endonuclease-3|nr:endonuclease III [Desulfovibrio sp.]